MVESSLKTGNCEDAGHTEIRDESYEPVLRREPSFSGWCGEDGFEHLDRLPDDSRVSVEDSDFELPLLQEEWLENGNHREKQVFGRFGQRSMDLNGGHDNMSVYIEENGGEKKYVPFDIEDDSVSELRFSDLSSDSNLSRRKQETADDVQSSVSMAAVVKALVYILAWYIFSTSLTLYNKLLLGDKLGKFPAPMLLNTVHFSVQAALSKIIVRIWSQTLEPTVTMSWKDYFLRVVPTALGTALDINLSNASLVLISVTFATMCKSAGPIFLLLFAFAFKLESPSIKLVGIIVVISIGVLLTVTKETEFNFWGFVFVMLAAVMSGFRWAMTQILLQKEAYGLNHPITMMSYVTPVMAAATALLSLMTDPWSEFKRNEYFSNSTNVVQSILLMLIGASLAFCMVLTEYVLVSVTSAVTVMIAGVVKEAVTIVVAVLYFHDEFTFLKGIGLITIMIGVSLFNWYKYQKLQGQTCKNSEETGSPVVNGAAKYAILENMDDQDDYA